MSESRVSRRGFLIGGLSVLAGIGGTAGWAADRYLIPHVEVTSTDTLGTGAVTVADAASDGQATATGYASSTARVSIDTLVTGNGDDKVTGYIADVQVSDATIIRSAFADDTFGTNVIAKTSEIAEQANAVLAINGDYYGFRDTGIVIRNGVTYRDDGARQGLLLSTDGTLSLYDETGTSADELLAQGAWQTWSFGPGLVEGGAIIDGIDQVEIDTNVGNHSVQGNQPRTAIGMIAANHFLFVAVDGRSTGYSRGMTMTELAQLFVDRGAQVAYNLDGGGSTTMVLNGDLVNDPLGRDRERGTSDIIYVAG
ncbi:MAG: phosphodiester glycosidase family protein [Microlunatus sp.]